MMLSMHITQTTYSPAFQTPARASGRVQAAPRDVVDLSAPSVQAAPRAVPASVLEEVRKTFRPPDSNGYGSGRASNEDVSLDTGLQVSHRSGGGGCFGPSEHYWTLKEPGQSEGEQIAIGTGVLESADGCSVNSDGTFVVGRFSRYEQRKDDRRERDLQELRDQGLYSKERGYGTSYLVDVPLKKGFFGKLPAAMRRKGWLPQRILTALPPDAGVFDVGPDKSVAIAQNDRVLRWTKKEGLQPWLQLNKPVQDLEYLSDGSLGVMTQAEVGSDLYVFPKDKPGEPHFIPFKEGFPEQYEQHLRARVQGVDFMRGASTDQIETFLEHSDWLKKDNWYQQCSGFGQAVVIWKAQPELCTYDRETGRSQSFGPLVYPQSERLKPVERWSFQAQGTEDGKFMLITSRPEKEGGPVDVGVWDLTTGKPELVPGVRDVKLDAARSELKVTIITGEERTIPLATVPELKKEEWYTKARLADLLDSDAELKPEQQIGEDAQKIIVGGVHVRKKD